MAKTTLLINTIHALLCDLPHESKMQDFVNTKRKPDVCYYYLEENIAECWELYDHQYWSSEAESIKEKLGTTDSQEALRSIYRVLDLIENVTDLTNEEYNFFTRLLQLSSSCDEVP